MARATEEKALKENTAGFRQKPKLLVGFHALRNDVDVKFGRHRQESSEKGNRHGARRDLRDDLSIELQRVNREMSEVCEGRVSLAKIINGEAKAFARR